ncbi:unnamed protein product, partial [Protopolystoma xenopodis]
MIVFMAISLSVVEWMPLIKPSLFTSPPCIFKSAHAIRGKFTDSSPSNLILIRFL